MVKSTTAKKPKLVHTTEDATSRIVTMTPELAAQYLGQRSEDQRRLNRSLVAEYALAIENDRWMFTGEPIILDWNNKLIDGQHRLSSIVDTGATVTMNVVEGVDPAAFVHIDTGQKRSHPQILHMAGEKNANILSATLGMMRRYEHKDIRGRIGRTQVWEKIDRLNANPDIRSWCTVYAGQYWVRQYVASPSIMIMLWHEAARKHDYDFVMRFIEALASGADLKQGNPILTLREWLTGLKTAGYRLGFTDLYGTYLQCWNAFATGQKLSKIEPMTDDTLLSNWEIQ